jgi:hypothetical protein
MSLPNLPLPVIAGIVFAGLVLLFFLFRRSPAPQHVASSLHRKQGTGCLTWVLIGLVVGLALPQLPWLFTHLPVRTLPMQLLSPHSPTPAVAPAPAPGTRAYYIWYAQQEASAVHLNPDVFVRQIDAESHFNPSALSPKGAIGIAQFMPQTARAWGVDPHNPEQSLKGAAKLMAHLLSSYHGDYAKALAAYNAGEGAVNRAVSRGGVSWQAYLPSETQHYIAVIL